MDLKSKIRNINDFPEKGVIFRDITTLIKDAEAFAYVTETMAEQVSGQDIDMIVVLDARGFLFGAPVAYLLKKGVVPVRKKDKLPAETYQVEYALEYGTGSLEMHKDALEKGMRVAIFDDLLATGGTAKAACELVEKAGAQVASLNFVIELKDLRGREKLEGYQLFSLLEY
ncbi:MAG: adenine phosphoribosyltransferase [Christensenella hongkongensis]|uniref:adenine phosphoribosyltransferase n=1 Tax=Christensenella hongkongensis TaxID=270498 RepID=UPI002A7485EC|nr:adenine phosphoribosyltransferase [Christensenella hongkongensis]MDY3004593.1 adenine phosphoribosyltransferase [Christensenella hongkongensis]